MSLFSRKPKETVSVTYISHSGASRQVAVPVDSSVMEGAISNNVEGIVAECGGSCMCATCHVYVDDTFLGKLVPIAENEEEMLNSTASPRLANSRLGCQIRLTPNLDGLIVTTPETQQ
jgi:2Fe-2S ferredoxin